MTLQTQRLLLRQWREEDLPSLIKLYADPRCMPYWEVKTPEESQKEYTHFVTSIEKNGWGFWAVELKESHQFIGLIGLETVGFTAHFTPAVEIGWRLHYDCWGKGYATEGALASLRYGFEELQLNEIVAFTAVANQRSRRVMEKLGMTHSCADDFDDPDLLAGHPFRRLVLYRLKQQEWQNSKSSKKESVVD
jgi:3-dehydroquinate dehydratase/shikimate dehydrogenase